MIKAYSAMKGIILMMAVFLSIHSLCFAGSFPPYIHYQGRLAEQGTGAPLNGRKNLTFSFYGSESGGDPVYYQTKEVEIHNGLFSAYIGQGEGYYGEDMIPDGIPAQVFTENPAQYLGIMVAGSNIEMTPRQLIGSVAYAYKAERAKEAESVMGQVIVDPGGNVGIGTQSPAARLHVAHEDMDTKAFIRASNFNPVPAAFWPDFDDTAPYLLRNALWVGWDDIKKVSRLATISKASI